MKCVAHVNWGADTTTLLRLYQSLVLTKFDYGCIVYASARESQLRKLNPIHHAGLRLATGAFRTSPAISLHCESGIPSLKLRRDRLLLNYAINVWANTTHINYTHIFNNELTNNYSERPTITRPTTIRIKELMNKNNIHFPQVYSKRFSESPPWLIPEINCRLDLTRYKKHVKKFLSPNFTVS